MVVEVNLLFSLIPISLFGSLNSNIISLLLLLGECFQQFFISFKIISFLFFPLKKIVYFQWKWFTMSCAQSFCRLPLFSVTHSVFISRSFFHIVTTSTFTHLYCRFDFLCLITYTLEICIQVDNAMGSGIMGKISSMLRWVSNIKQLAVTVWTNI